MWNLPYLIEVQICFSLAWLLYRFVLGRDSEFARNRAYLLFSAAMAFIVPLLSVPVFPGSEIHYYPGDVSGALTVDIVDGGAEAAGIGWEKAVRWGYLAGVMVMAALLALGIVRLWLKTRKLPVVVIDDTHVSYVEHMGPAFSFFNRIYLDVRNIPQEEIPQVITHELCHVRLRHSWDMVFAQGMRVVFWWNPFVWLWIRSLKEVHEYQADAAVLNNGFDSEQYIKLILQSLTGIHPEFVSGFSYSLIKKRLIMITKEKSKRFARLKVLLSLPLLGVMLLLFSFTERAPRIIVPAPEKVYYIDGKESDEKEVNELIPAKIQGVDIESGDSVKIVRVTTVDSDTDDAKTESGQGDLLLDRRIKRMDADTIHMLGKVVFSKSRLGNSNVKLFVDGAERPVSDMDKLNTNDIASVSVLKNQKDGSADRIMITTKKAGNTSFSAVQFSEANVQLSEAQATQIAETKVRLADAKVKLADAKTKLSDVNVKLSEAQTKLSNATVKLSESRARQFADAELYIDGVRCDIYNLDKINTDHVAHMSVLKNQTDGSADRIMITTKKTGNISSSVFKLSDAFGKSANIEFYMDGVKKDISALDRMNKNDIERIVVMKDQKDGSADRILVTTKSAQKESPKPGKTEPGQAAVAVRAEHLPEFRKSSGADLTAFRGWVMQRLKNQLKTSGEAGAKDVRERVVLSFVVEKDGSVGQVKVLQTSSQKLGVKAVQVVKSSPKWARPGRDKNGPVAVPLTMSVGISVPKKLRYN